MKSIFNIVTFSALLVITNAGELALKPPAFGVGINKFFEFENGFPQVVSKIVKNEYTYILERISDEEIKISRYNESNADAKESIVNFNRKLCITHPYSDVWISDLYASDAEISFLMVTGSGYKYFKVSNQSLAIPQGAFECERDGINSANWKVVQFQNGLSDYGYEFAEWAQNSAIDSIKLIAIDKIEIVVANSNNSVILTVAVDKIIKNNTPLENVELFNPSIMKESEIIEDFSLEVSPTLEKVRFMVSFYKGGKDFVLGLLNQFQDQNAANQIRARIEQAYSQ